jgi:hypothetical protein
MARIEKRLGMVFTPVIPATKEAEARGWRI